MAHLLNDVPPPPPPARKPALLPPAVAAKALAICLATGDAFDDVVADAVTLHFDELVAAGTVKR